VKEGKHHPNHLPEKQETFDIGSEENTRKTTRNRFLAKGGKKRTRKRKMHHGKSSASTCQGKEGPKEMPRARNIECLWAEER